MGNDLPMIVSKNTESEKFVNENDIGWAIEYNTVELEQLFSELYENKLLIQEKRENIYKIKNKHTWLERANRVINDLIVI